jgi:NADPH:quinone reductase-like Zn-dependent oxidoreductase
VRERQNADLGLNNMYVVSVLAHAEFALNPRRQQPSMLGSRSQRSVVVQLGYGTTGLTVGQRVFGLPDWARDGSLAE